VHSATLRSERSLLPLKMIGQRIYLSERFRKSICIMRWELHYQISASHLSCYCHITISRFTSMLILHHVGIPFLPHRKKLLASYYSCILCDLLPSVLVLMGYATKKLDQRIVFMSNIFYLSY